MKILALDLSLTATGICLPDGKTCTISEPTTGPARLYGVRNRIMDKLRLARAALVIVEGPSYRSQGRAMVSLGELRGVVLVALYELDMPVVDIPPAALKKYACGRGNATKDDVLQAAVHRSGRIFGDNNQADAWWLWQLGLCHYDSQNPALVKMPKAHLANLPRIAWEPEVG